MRLHRFTLNFLVLLIVQILFCNYFVFTPFITLSILPIMIIMMPVQTGTVATLLVAFAAAFSVDFFSDGLLALNALALVPVALLRRKFISLVFGSEVFARKENISIRRHGLLKMSVVLLMGQSLFLLIYIWADGAGTRPFWFNAARFAASLFAGYLVSIPFSKVLAKEDRFRWN